MMDRLKAIQYLDVSLDKFEKLIEARLMNEDVIDRDTGLSRIVKLAPHNSNISEISGR